MRKNTDQKNIKRIIILLFAVLLSAVVPASIAVSDSYDYALNFKTSSIVITPPQKIKAEYAVSGSFLSTPLVGSEQDITFIIEKKNTTDTEAIVSHKKMIYSTESTYTIEIDPLSEGGIGAGEYNLYGFVGTRTNQKSEIKSIPLTIKAGAGEFSISCAMNTSTELVNATFNVPESDKDKKIKVTLSTGGGDYIKDIVGERKTGAGSFTYSNDASTLSNGVYICGIYSYSDGVLNLKKAEKFTILRTAGDDGTPPPPPKTEINIKFPCPSSEFGIGECPEITTDSIPNYIVRLYQFGIGIAGILAVGMIIAGAIMYSISGAVDKKSEGKDMIMSALWGVLLLFGSYLILKTINPQLIDLKDPNAPQVKLATTTYSMASPHKMAGESKIRGELSAAGVGVNKGTCTYVGQTDCTEVYGLPDSTIQHIINIKKNCGCDVVITGGTESGHKTHGQGKPIVDLRFNEVLAKYLKETYTSNINAICTVKAEPDVKYRKNCTFNEKVRHLHVQFRK